MPLLNAAYEGIKEADPNTTVIGFNFATTAGSKADWEEYHTRAFALSPKFDWYGVQTHGVPPTALEEAGSYGGVQGLRNVRKFLNVRGYANKPLWVNEAGFANGEDLGGLPERIHAEWTVGNYILGTTLGVDLRGWVYFEYFAKEHGFEDGAGPEQPTAAAEVVACGPDAHQTIGFLGTKRPRVETTATPSGARRRCDGALARTGSGSPTARRGSRTSNSRRAGRVAHPSRAPSDP